MKPLDHALIILLFAMLVGCSPSQDSAQSGTKAADTEAESSQAPDVTAIAHGAATAGGANGMHFGPDGLLYMASVAASELIALDPRTGEVKRRLGAADGVDGPDDVAFAPDGAFYWTSIMTGEVAGFTADGSLVTAANLTPGVNPITFSDDGRLFVSQCFFDDKLYELDPAGVEEPRLISDQLGPGCGLNGMDWGPDGRLYGPRWYVGEVVSFDVDEKTMRTEATGIKIPAAVKFDSKGRLHVLDTGLGQIIRIEGDKRTVVAEIQPGLDNFAFDEQDQIFVSSFVDGFIKRVEADGSLTTLLQGGMTGPAGLTFHGDDIIVADGMAVRGFNRQTGAPVPEKSAIGLVDDLGGAINIAADGDNLVLTSWQFGGVRVWDPVQRQLLASFADYVQPVSAVRFAGEIVVAEHGKNRVVSAADSAVTYADNLPAPTGLAVSGGDLYVTDRSRGEILQIAGQGKPLTEPRVVASGLDSPEGIAVLGDGFVVVEAASGHITQVAADGTRTQLAALPPNSAEAGPGQPPSMQFDGVIADGRDVYVTNHTERKLYRIRLP
jgi:sugar lactone lactonase YvrE|tara:strand:- start:41 stop:1696 length:1656 start_codon:yes stop_codon:yes gene_type:complete